MTVTECLSRLRDSPRITVALRDAELLADAAVRSTDPTGDAMLLRVAIEHDDDIVAIASIHAIGSIADPIADAVLLDLIIRGDEPLVSHAAWVFAARRPSPRAIPVLVDLVAAGGFTAMLAERTLSEWSRAAPSSVAVPALLVPKQPVADRSHLTLDGWRGEHSGLVIVQPFLHARLDGSGSSLGAGDAGGIASLLRSLGTSLSERHEVDEVITITRAEPLRNGGDAALSDRLADAHRIERIPYGSTATVPWREAWQYRIHLEREMAAIGRALRGRRVVWHLRMADVGTLAASAVARRLGQPVVFTAAPDPHVVIDALEADGRLDRSRFGMEDAASQYWFRARMVERLSTQVEHLALLPRPTLLRELVELVGLDADDLRERSDIVPEGVDVAAVDASMHRFAASGRLAPAVAEVLAGIPSHRRHLPWILTVGRMNTMKGPHRIVAALAGSASLTDAFNLVMVGGDLDDPSPDERSALDQVRSAARTLPDGVVHVVGHRPPDQICDLLVHAAETAGIYVCASDKEEFGLAIVEAMAAGMVVVAPQRGGPRTYIDDGRTGILCDTASVDALGAAMERAATMSLDVGRMVWSRTFVRSELSIGTMAERLTGIYEALAPVATNAA